MSSRPTLAQPLYYFLFQDCNGSLRGDSRMQTCSARVRSQRVKYCPGRAVSIEPRTIPLLFFLSKISTVSCGVTRVYSRFLKVSLPRQSEEPPGRILSVSCHFSRFQRDPIFSIQDFRRLMGCGARADFPKRPSLSQSGESTGQILLASCHFNQF